MLRKPTVGTIGDSLHRAASVFEQKPGCGCAKRQARMNAIVPGSGDAAKAVFSGVGRGIERVARLIEPSPGIVAPQAPAVILPRAQAERTPQHRPSPWTVPPIPAPGWEVAEECAAAMVFRSGLKFIVWSIEGGVYSKSHTFSTDENGARLEFARRCR